MSLDTSWMNISSEEVYEIIKDLDIVVKEYFIDGDKRPKKLPQPFQIMIHQVDETNVDLYLCTYGEHQYSKMLEEQGMSMSSVYKTQHGYDKWSTDRVNRIVSLLVGTLNMQKNSITCRVLDGMEDISKMRSTKFVKGTQLRPRVKISLTRTYHWFNLDNLSNVLIVK